MRVRDSVRAAYITATGPASAIVIGDPPVPARGPAISTRLSGGGFPLDVSDVLSLDKTVEAYARIEAGERGRIVIRIAE